LLYVSSVSSMCYCVDLYFYSSESEICIARCNTIIVMFVTLAGYKCLMLFFSVFIGIFLFKLNREGAAIVVNLVKHNH
jgi:hypothetical protein